MTGQVGGWAGGQTGGWVRGWGNKSRGSSVAGTLLLVPLGCVAAGRCPHLSSLSSCPCVRACVRACARARACLRGERWYRSKVCPQLCVLAGMPVGQPAHKRPCQGSREVALVCAAVACVCVCVWRWH